MRSGPKKGKSTSTIVHAVEVHQRPETINGLYKAEVIHCRGPWRTLEAVEFATLEWVDWFNNRRLFEPIGNILPADGETNCYAVLDDRPMAA